MTLINFILNLKFWGKVYVLNNVLGIRGLMASFFEFRLFLKYKYLSRHISTHFSDIYNLELNFETQSSLQKNFDGLKTIFCMHLH